MTSGCLALRMDSTSLSGPLLTTKISKGETTDRRNESRHARVSSMDPKCRIMTNVSAVAMKGCYVALNEGEYEAFDSGRNAEIFSCRSIWPASRRSRNGCGKVNAS